MAVGLLEFLLRPRDAPIPLGDYDSEGVWHPHPQRTESCVRRASSRRASGRIDLKATGAQLMRKSVGWA